MLEQSLSTRLKRFFSILSLLLSVFNLLVGLGFLFLGGRYLLDMFGLIDIPNPVWIGWFVDDLTGMGMSAKSSQAVVWAMTFLGASLIITSIDYLYVKVLQFSTQFHGLVNRLC